MRLLLAAVFLLVAVLLVIAQELPDKPGEQRLVDSTDLQPQLEGAPPEPAPGNEISVQTVATDVYPVVESVATAKSESSSTTKKPGHKLVKPRPKPISVKRRLILKKLLAKRKHVKRTTQHPTSSSSVHRPSP